MFDRLEKDLKEALAAIDASSEHLEKARRMDISQIPVRTELASQFESISQRAAAVGPRVALLSRL